MRFAVILKLVFRDGFFCFLLGLFGSPFAFLTHGFRVEICYWLLFLFLILDPLTFSRWFMWLPFFFF
ncbi:Predicted protein [Mesomycoplasma hyopneumoniae 168]|uniref:Uncharacterized protein n=2 Tax=Mesomycoplasma hyopneumoniae (strain 168) TaxID=907287 RepID=E4QTA5_MESH1|nr:Predicted protein [Mesomycoplasma hyopneumoniae 168]